MTEAHEIDIRQLIGGNEVVQAATADLTAKVSDIHKVCQTYLANVNRGLIAEMNTIFDQLVMNTGSAVAAFGAAQHAEATALHTLTQRMAAEATTEADVPKRATRKPAVRKTTKATSGKSRK